MSARTALSTVHKSTNSDVQKSLNTTNTVWNLGASWTWFKSITFGFGIERESNESLTTTGGQKTYAQTYLNDKGLPANWPTGTTEGSSAKVTFINQEVDTNSDIVMNVMPQVQLKLGDVVTANAGIGLRTQNNYNPNSILPTAVTITATNRHQLAGAAAGDPLYNDEFKGIRNPADIAKMDFDDFTTAGYSSLVNQFDAAYNGVGGAGPAIVSFKDDRTGTGPIVRLGAKLYFLEGALNISSVKQDVDCEIKYRDYISLKQYITAAQKNDYSIDRNITDTSKGDATVTNMDFAVKVKLLDNKDIKVAFAPGISNAVTTEKLTSKRTRTIAWAYDDGLAANNPGAVAIGVGVEPGDVAVTAGPNDDGSGEGTAGRSTVTEFTEDNEKTVTEFKLPVGLEIPISKKFTFRAGTSYSIVRNEDIKKKTTKNETQVDTATPAGGAVATRTIVTSPVGSDVEKSTYWSESHVVAFTYGIQWDVNDYLTVATNAFLDTNPNIGGAAKASLFDLDTYRCLAIQAVVKF